MKTLTLLSVCTVIILGSSFISHTIAESNAKRKQSLEIERIARLRATWNSLEFKPVHSHLVYDALSNALRHSSVSLDQERADSLCQALTNSVGYLNDPSFIRFMSLKTNGASFRLEASRAIQAVLAGNTNLPTNGPLLSRIELAWNEVGRKRNRQPSLNLALFSPASTCVNVTTGFPSFENLRNAWSARFTALDSGMRYVDDYPNGTNQLSAVVEFVGRFFPSGISGPMAFSFSWSKTDRNWHPKKLYYDGQTYFNTLF
jgi:hypothetical protein